MDTAPMLKKTPFGWVLLVLLAACPKATVRATIGTEDEQLDRLTAQLEEIRSRSRTRELSCADRCTFAESGCQISREICAIATGQSPRRDRQQACASSQEDCAAITDSCLRCR